MALEDAVIGSLVGTLLGFLLGLYSQRWSMRRSTNESTKERVYSPLFDEIEECLDRLRRGEPLVTTQWMKVSNETHLSYLIEPPEFDDKLREFYGDTDRELSSRISACIELYQDLVRKDILSKVPSAYISATTNNASETMQAAIEVSRAVGSNLHKGRVWWGNLQFFNSSYEKLSPELKGSFSEYFESWKTKSHDDDVMKEYRSAHHNAESQAQELRKMLARKLGKKL